MVGLLGREFGIFLEEEGIGSALVFSQLSALKRWKEKAKLLVFIRRGCRFEMQARGMTGQ